MPRLLFISPTSPDTQGNGLAMRAGMFIEALAQRYRVSLLVVPLFDSRTSSSEALIRRYCADDLVVQPREKATTWERLSRRGQDEPELLRLMQRRAKACASALGDARFDVIHAFRLYTAPLAIALADRHVAGPRPQLHLDIDDYEPASHASLAQLYRSNGLVEEADAEAREGAQYVQAEATLLPRFDRVYVCTQGDAEHIGATPRDVRIVPNAVRPPAEALARLTSHPFTFLFVGTLGYYPNNDAIRYFCSEVLPRIRAQATRPFLVRIVGSGVPGALASLSQIEELRLIGRVADVAREYAEADAIIVPVRAGGGTRIKVLEAFAHRRPVVSSSVGAEGIEAEPGADYLPGDTPEALAAQCLRLMQEPDLGPALASHAWPLLQERYSQEAVNRLVAALL